MNVFAAIVEAGSFTRAAQSLDVSPSVVTRALSRLEDHLGMRLLNRTTRALSLTDDGRRFHQRIVPVLAEMQDVADFAANAQASIKGRLRIHVDPFVSRLVLAPALGLFLDRHPELEVDIVTRDPPGLAADAIDLAIRFGEPQTLSLVARRLLTTRIVTVASPAYLKRKGTPRVPEDLLNGRHACIHYRNPDSGRPFPWEFRKEGLRVVVPATGPVTVNDVGTMLGLCVAGHGIAQAMTLGIEPQLTSGQLVQVLQDHGGETFPLYALYPSRRLLPAKTSTFLQFVVDLLRSAEGPR